MYCNVKRKRFNIEVIIFLWNITKGRKAFLPKNY